ncbi:MAG: hypothetical protein WDA16_10885 [Candidatus Thermoplasmatota archaeon]
MRTAILGPIVILAIISAGCTTSGSRVTRDQLDFEFVTSVQGVNASPSGDIALVGTNGIVVASNASVHAVQLALGPVVSTRGAFVACGPSCNTSDVPPGMVVAEASLVSHHDIALNARGPDSDASIFFFDNGSPGGQSIRWVDAESRFQISNATEVDGEVLAVGGSVGTATRADLPDAAYVVTSALEGNTVSIYLRGSAIMTNGTARVAFPLGFVVLVGDGDITAQVTLTSRGPTLWVSEKTRDHLTVETATPSVGVVTFDYFVQAPRVGGEAFVTLR